MRRKLALVLAGVMVIASLAGCGGGTPATSTTAAGSDNAASANAELNLIIASNRGIWLDAMIKFNPAITNDAL